MNPLRTFGWAILGLFCLTIAADFVTGGLFAGIAAWLVATPVATGITDSLGIPWSLGEPDPFEARDFVLMGLYAAVGIGLIVHGFRDLILPRKVLSADEEGFTVRLSGWFGGSSHIPWSIVDDVRAGMVVNLDRDTPSLMITVTDRAGLPLDPWGARWVDEFTLAVLANHWTHTPKDVAIALDELAIRSRLSMAGE